MWSSELWRETLVKPLLGQLQNQANLDDLLGSSKSVGGNFGRPGFVNGKKADKAGDSSFTDMLLNTINKSASNKQASKPQAPTAAAKIPDQTPRVARPAVKQATPDKHTTSSGHPSDLAESTFKTSSRPAREDSEYYSEATKLKLPMVIQVAKHHQTVMSEQQNPVLPNLVSMQVQQNLKINP